MTDRHLENFDEKILPDDNKATNTVITDTLSVDSKDADEALELVGIRREVQFSEEYNLKLRRKLVCPVFFHSEAENSTYQPVGLDYTSSMRCRVLYAILVSLVPA